MRAFGELVFEQAQALPFDEGAQKVDVIGAGASVLTLGRRVVTQLPQGLDRQIRSIA
jgi:hypothetical protein